MSALSIAAPIVFAPAVLVFAAQAGAVSRLLCKPLFLALGERSYSIYLIHFVVAWIVSDAFKLLKVLGVDLYSDERFGRGLWEGDLVYVVYFALVLCAATITYRVIEVPTRAWFRRLAGSPVQEKTRVELKTAPQPAVIPIRTDSVEQ